MANKKKQSKPIWNGPEGSIIGQYELPDRQERRAAGHMTYEEFVDKLETGLRYYLLNNWKDDDSDGLHHPEDLASAALAFVESIYIGIQTFGAGNTNE